MTRRQLLEQGGFLTAAATTLLSGAATAQSNQSNANQPSAPAPAEKLKLGLCSYTFREFQRDLAIKMCQQVGVKYVSVKEVHLPYTVTPAEAAKARAAFEKAGLTIVSGGVIDMHENDPKLLRSYFDYAKLCGMPMIVAAPSEEVLPNVEKLIKEYNIPVAIHDHGPEDKHFPSPRSVLNAVKDMDPRIGLCMDVGHAMRAGADVVETVSEAGPRLFDIHMKDLRSRNDKASQCDVGEGVMPVLALFKALESNNYKGHVNLEYEINGDNPLPGTLHSMGYMRGVVVGLAGA